jgi:adenylate cyclase
MAKIHVFGPFRLDAEAEILFRGAEPVRLGRRAVALLRVLVERPGAPVSKDALIEAAWSGLVVEDANLTVQIAALRRALSEQPGGERWIETLPRRGYRYVGPPASEETGAPAPHIEGTPALPLPNRPSIAVLPFQNMSGNAEQEYFIDGVVEDIIIELSRFSELFVIARNSSFQYKGKSIDLRQIGRELGVQYLLEGSIRRSGDRVRITAQLIDARTRAHRWAERYDRTLQDVFAIQDEIAHTIASLLAAHINKAEAQRTLLKPPASWEAHDYFLRGNEALINFVSRFSVSDLHETRKLLEQSIQLDPGYARAYAMLASSHIAGYLTHVSGEYLHSQRVERAFQLARKAVELAPNLPLAHAHLADAQLFRREFEQSLASWNKVFEFNSNFTDWRYGQALIFAGQFQAGLAAIKRHMRLDPFSPPPAVLFLGLAYIGQKLYAEAIHTLREFVTRAPHFRNGRLLLASACACAGNIGEARAQIDAVLKIEPGFTMREHTRGRFFRSPGDIAHMFEGLRDAGLPE